MNWPLLCEGAGNCWAARQERIRVNLDNACACPARVLGTKMGSGRAVAMAMAMVAVLVVGQRRGRQ